MDLKSRYQASGLREEGTRGFSIIELMVVTSIFMILSTVVLSANARFGNLVVLQGLAHEIALSVRQAQVYGIAVRRFSGTGFDVAYGMYFKMPVQNGASSYQLFGDLDEDGLYDAGGETVENTTIGGGYYIDQLWVRNAESEAETQVQELAVVFRRPEPDACISAGTSATFDGNNKCTLSPYDQARVIISSRSGTSVQVIVQSSGQISVEAI